MKKIFVSIMLATVSTLSVAAEGRWTEGFGQGNLEYFIDKQGASLHIGCPTKDGSADASSDVNLYILHTMQPVQKFIIKVNGLTFDAPFSTSSRVGANNFITLLEALRKGDAVVEVGKKRIVFPKSNAAKVIPVYGHKDFECNVF